MSSGDLESLIDLAITSLDRARIVNYVNVLSLALVVYDFFLTFDEEVRLVWPSKWNVGKIMFFLTRYPVFLDNAFNLTYLLQPGLDLSLCKPLYQAAAWMSFTGITIAEIIMMMRTYAIWGKRRDILIFLIALNLGIIIPDIIFLQKSLRSLVFMPSPFPTLAPCVLASADLAVYIDFILIMVSEFVVIALTLWRCYSQWRANKSNLMKALLEDGLQYFVCMFAISLGNLLVVKIAPVDYSGLLLELQRVLHSILSARMLLDIRAAVAPPVESHATTMSFAAAPGKAPPNQSGDHVELGEIQSQFSSDRDTRTVSSGPSVITEKNGPLSGIHITRGTLADEDLHRVGLEERRRFV